MKKGNTWKYALMFILAITAAFNGFAAGKAEESESVQPGEQKELVYDVLVQTSKDKVAPEDEDNIFDQVIKEEFNIVFERERIPSANSAEKVQLLFAGGEAPELVWFFGNWNTIRKLGEDGHLIAFNDYLDRLPNYMKWFEDDWDEVKQFVTAADGNIYTLPVRQHTKASRAWIYRKSAFDKYGLTFPETADELYQALTVIKANDPDQVAIPNRWGTGYLLGGFSIMYRVQWGAYVDPDTKEFVPYGAVTEKFRNLLTFVRKLYQEGLIDQEFATSTTQQWNERYANGQAYIEYSWANRAEWASDLMGDNFDPNVEWEWSRENIVADPDVEKKLYSRDKGFDIYGRLLTKRLSDEKLDRILDFYDWVCTDEGLLKLTYGIEGETYHMVDGKPKFLPHMFEADQAGQVSAWKYGLDNNILVRNPDVLVELKGPAELEVNDNFVNNPDYTYMPNLAFIYTEDESKMLADYETVVNDIRNEYVLKFIMGELDPTDNADWKEFKDTIASAGLEKVSKIYTDVYNRMY